MAVRGKHAMQQFTLNEEILYKIPNNQYSLTNQFAQPDEQKLDNTIIIEPTKKNTTVFDYRNAQTEQRFVESDQKCSSRIRNDATKEMRFSSLNKPEISSKNQDISYNNNNVILNKPNMEDYSKSVRKNFETGVKSESLSIPIFIREKILASSTDITGLTSNRSYI